MLQKTTKNILWYGECSCLLHGNQRYSWTRITQTISIPSRIQKISQWNKCSTHLQNWCPNKMRSMEWVQSTGNTLHGSIYLWLVMNKSSVSCTQRSTSFQILYCVLARYTRTPNQTLHRNTDWVGSKVHQNAETWRELTASQWNSSGIFSVDLTRCSSVKKSKVYFWD